MGVESLGIEGAWLITTRIHGDDRGLFLEWFKEDPFVESVGHPFHLAQANCSVSARGVLRGIHYADVPPGQAKYVTCVKGRILDVVVDIRVGSPTFGQWEAVRLDEESRNAVYISEGLGHAFLSLEDGSTVVYLCSEPYAPTREREIHPLDPFVGIEWPLARNEMELSSKDSAAPSLIEAQAADSLPSFDQCVTYRSTLADAGSAPIDTSPAR